MSMYKLALIIPYFGKFNNYFEFWRTSAEHNPSVDFLIFTDQHIKSSQNIKVVQSTITSINELIRTKLEKYLHSVKELTLVNRGGVIPYKLCDFKPLYGLIFEDYLKDYDYWGHCDVDLIFGDIRQFLTDDVLSQHKRILSRGHFSLYRNEPDCNLFFLRSKNYDERMPDYRKVYSNLRPYAFDEWSGLSRIWKEQCPEQLYNEIIFDDINCLHKDFLSCQKREMDSGRSHFLFAYDHGTLLRYYLEGSHLCSEPTMYVHFQKRSMNLATADKEQYLIVPNKFISFTQPNEKMLKKYGRRHFLYLHAISIRFNNLKKKLKGYRE